MYIGSTVKVGTLNFFSKNKCPLMIEGWITDPLSQIQKSANINNNNNDNSKSNVKEIKK